MAQFNSVTYTNAATPYFVIAATPPGWISSGTTIASPLNIIDTTTYSSGATIYSSLTNTAVLGQNSTASYLANLSTGIMISEFALNNDGSVMLDIFTASNPIQTWTSTQTTVAGVVNITSNPIQNPYTGLTISQVGSTSIIGAVDDTNTYTGANINMSGGPIIIDNPRTSSIVTLLGGAIAVVDNYVTTIAETYINSDAITMAFNGGSGVNRIFEINYFPLGANPGDIQIQGAEGIAIIGGGLTGQGIETKFMSTGQVAFNSTIIITNSVALINPVAFTISNSVSSFIGQPAVEGSITELKCLNNDSVLSPYINLQASHTAAGIADIQIGFDKSYYKGTRFVEPDGYISVVDDLTTQSDSNYSGSLAQSTLAFSINSEKSVGYGIPFSIEVNPSNNPYAANTLITATSAIIFQEQNSIVPTTWMTLSTNQISGDHFVAMTKLVVGDRGISTVITLSQEAQISSLNVNTISTLTASEISFSSPVIAPAYYTTGNIPVKANPAGAIITWAGGGINGPYGTTPAPAGYVYANGASYNGSLTQYANLFAAIGQSYGGSGTNFNVPNLTMGRIPISSTPQNNNVNTIAYTLDLPGAVPPQGYAGLQCLYLTSIDGTLKLGMITAGGLSIIGMSGCPTGGETPCLVILSGSLTNPQNGSTVTFIMPSAVIPTSYSAYRGEYQHQQTTYEVAPHTHQTVTAGPGSVQGVQYNVVSIPGTTSLPNNGGQYTSPNGGSGNVVYNTAFNSSLLPASIGMWYLICL